MIRPTRPNAAANSHMLSFRQMATYTGTAIVMTSEATDDLPVVLRSTNHDVHKIKLMTGYNTYMTPPPVATPLPPTNLRVIGNVWPITAA